VILLVTVSRLWGASLKQSNDAGRSRACLPGCGWGRRNAPRIAFQRRA